MKALQTIAGFGLHSGGTTSCTYDLLEAMNRVGMPTDILTPGLEPGSDDRLAGRDEEWVKAVPYDCRTPYAYSSNFRQFLRDTDFSIYKSVQQFIC